MYNSSPLYAGSLRCMIGPILICRKLPPVCRMKLHTGVFFCMYMSSYCYAGTPLLYGMLLQGCSRNSSFLTKCNTIVKSDGKWVKMLQTEVRNLKNQISDLVFSFLPSCHHTYVCIGKRLTVTVIHYVYRYMYFSPAAMHHWQ